MAKKRRINLSEIGQATVNKEEFVGHNTVGGAEVTGNWGSRLPHNLQDELRTDNPDYVVVHHSTPIAWHGESGWKVPDIKYSSTTSRRQNAIRRSVNQHFAEGHDGARG